MHNMTDIANYFLIKEKMNKIKVQQLCYLYVGWSLALKKKLNIKNPLFVTSHNGVVNPSCEEEYKDFGFDNITKINQNIHGKFDNKEIDILDAVYDYYKHYCYQELEVIVSRTIPFYEIEHFYGYNYPIELSSMETYFKKLNKIKGGE